MRTTHRFRNSLSFLAAIIVYILARVLYLSCKKEIIRSPEAAEYEASGKPLIYAFWHGRMFPMGFLKPRHRKVYTIISRHGDGQLIANVMMLLGIKAVRGSSNRKPGDKKGFMPKNRGGAFVIRRSIAVVEEGNSLAITPDGPKGPGFVFKQNSIKIAAETGAAILPVSFSASNAKVFSSWDKFLLPMPFSKIKVSYGVPKFISQINSAEEAEKYGKQLQDELNNLTSELDKQFGIEAR